MRALLLALGLAVAGWSVWWYVAANGRTAGLTDWLAERSAEGWVAEAGEIATSGYPNRIDTRIEDLSLANPDVGWAWSAEAFEILSLAYDRSHYILAWPGAQTFGSPEERVTVTGATLRGSVVFEDRATLALDRSAIEAEDVMIESTAGWRMTLAQAQLNTRRAAEGAAPGAAHEVALSRARDLTLPAPLKDLLDPADLMPEAVQSAEFDVTLSFDAPWDRQAVESVGPELVGFAVRRFQAQWGEVALGLRGRVVADASGRAEGALDITARNWRTMIRLAANSGALDPVIADAVEQALGLIALISGDRDTIEVPLRFSGGTMRLGPVPIGDAPRLN
ncbi:MAG: DUF2125 domain-containing protein [Pseudomonadota bacterium]